MTAPVSSPTSASAIRTMVPSGRLRSTTTSTECTVTVRLKPRALGSNSFTFTSAAVWVSGGAVHVRASARVIAHKLRAAVADSWGRPWRRRAADDCKMAWALLFPQGIAAFGKNNTVHRNEMIGQWETLCLDWWNEFQHAAAANLRSAESSAVQAHAQTAAHHTNVCNMKRTLNSAYPHSRTRATHFVAVDCVLVPLHSGIKLGARRAA